MKPSLLSSLPEPEHPLDLVAVRVRRRAVVPQPRIPALECLTCAVFVVDDGGRMLHANRRARRLVALRDGLGVTPHGLVAGRDSDTVALREAVTAALGLASDLAAPRAAALTVPRPSGRRAFGVLAIPADPTRHARSARALVLVSDPEERRAPAPALLQRLLGLTPTEARLASYLAAEGTLAAAARSAGLSLGTARSHLKSLFRKTGAVGQADLVRLLLSSVAGVIDPGPLAN